MTPLAIGAGGVVLSLIGLLLGLVVLLVVVILFRDVASAARQIARAIEEIRSVPLITNGVRGLDEMRRARELSSRIPDLANAYLNKVRGR